MARRRSGEQEPLSYASTSASERAPEFWARVRELEKKAATEQGRARATHLMAVGDLLAAADLPPAAAVRYGAAIDAYLEAGYYSFAHRMCLRLLEAAPEVIRAHATLALIFIGRGLRQEAAAELETYVRLSAKASKLNLAVRRLCLMAQVVEDAAVRELILGHIRHIVPEAFVEPGPCVACEHSCQRAVRRWETPGLYWERLVDIGLMGPHELLAATPLWDVTLRAFPAGGLAQLFF